MTSNGRPAPAGVATGANSALLQGALNRKYGARSPKYSNPTLLNNIFADNRAGSWTNLGVGGIGLLGDTGVPGIAGPVLRWDVGAADGAGPLTVYGSVVDSSATDTRYAGGTSFVLGTGSSILPPDGTSTGTGIGKVKFMHTYDTVVSVANWRTFPAFRPAAIVTLELPVQQVTDYRLDPMRPTPLDPVVDKGSASVTVAPYPVVTAPTTDIDDGARPSGPSQDIGADEYVAPPPANLLDDFNRVDSSAGLGGDWTNRSASNNCSVLGINGQAASGQCSGFSIWSKTPTATASDFGSTQEVGATVTSLPASTNTSISLILKANGNAGGGSRPQRYLEVRYTESTHQVQVGYATNSANPTFVGTISVDFNAGDVIKANATPTGVQVFKNGVQQGATVSITAWGNANNNAGGQVGLRYTPAGSPAANSTKVDDFFGGTNP
jgi:hypothetical protein